MSETSPITELPARLRAEYGITLTYRDIYRDVVNGLVPAARGRDGRNWVVRLSDIPAIAEFYGARAEVGTAAAV